VKAAIVTGAARGIGASIAQRLAADGLRVALLDLDEAELGERRNGIASRGGEAVALRCDVSRRDDVERALAEIERRWGAPTVMVNNAGVGGPFHRADEVSDEEWDWIINTNLRSVFLFCRRLLPKMKEAGIGRIINIASIQGMLGAMRSSTYSASKHGMIGYTRSVAAEWGEYGITCNAICPGYVDTRMGVQTDDAGDQLPRVMNRTPARRVGRPEEIASLASYLAGPEGAFVNGAALVVDGGLSAHVGI
jgi:3-oxoacyl-[acyl-carrier protein] reductase